MARVEVLRVDDADSGMGSARTGEHVWVVVEFASGVMVNVRVDEHVDATKKEWSPVVRLKVGRNSGWVKEREVRL